MIGSIYNNQVLLNLSTLLFITEKRRMVGKRK